MCDLKDNLEYGSKALHTDRTVQIPWTGVGTDISSQYVNSYEKGKPQHFGVNISKLACDLTHIKEKLDGKPIQACVVA
jgi:hypothetical protein